MHAHHYIRPLIGIKTCILRFVGVHQRTDGAGG